VRLREWGLRLEERRVTAYVNSALNPTPTLPANPTANDIHKAIRDGGLISQEDLLSVRTTVRGLTADQGRLQGLAGMDPDAARGELNALAARYGIDPMTSGMDEQALTSTLQAMIERDLEVAHGTAVAHTATYLHAWLAEAGDFPKPEDLGLQGTDQVWRDALATVPGMSLINDDLDSVAGFVRDDVGMFVLNLDGAPTAFQASLVWDDLVSQFGETALRQAGIADAGTVERWMFQAHSQLQNTRQTATGAAQEIQRFLGSDTAFDMENPVHRGALREQGARYLSVIDGLMGDIDRLPEQLWAQGVVVRQGEADARRDIIDRLTNSMGYSIDQLIQLGVISQQTNLFGVAQQGQYNLNKGQLRSWLTETQGLVAPGITATITLDALNAARAAGRPASED
jgi:hypothetical protein